MKTQILGNCLSCVFLLNYNYRNKEPNYKVKHLPETDTRSLVFRTFLSLKNSFLIFSE